MFNTSSGTVSPTFADVAVALAEIVNVVPLFTAVIVDPAGIPAPVTAIPTTNPSVLGTVIVGEAVVVAACGIWNPAESDRITQSRFAAVVSAAVPVPEIVAVPPPHFKMPLCEIVSA
jgi:hypothetical protein